MASSSSNSIIGQKLFEGKTKTIYSVIDQPNLICIHLHSDSSTSPISIPSARRLSVDSAFRFNTQQQSRNNILNSNTEITRKSILTTSITACVYEILREAAIPTFYVASHPQPNMFIANKCTMIPLLWIIRRLANETYVKRNPEIINGHRFKPPIIEIYYKHHPIVYRRPTLGNLDDNLDTDRENHLDNDDDDDDSDSDECISSIWSYEQLLNTNIDLGSLKISQTDIEYMYEICCTVFDIFEHVWMFKKNCQLIDLQIEFGITTTPTKEIVIANIYDVETWHILRPIEKAMTTGNDLIQENLIWINNSLRDILSLNISIPLTAKIESNYKSDVQKKFNVVSDYDYIDADKDKTIYSTSFSPSTTSRCIIVCSSSDDIQHGQKMKTTLNEIYNIQCDIRLFSIYKSTQTILKFLSDYSYEHCRPSVFVTLGNINNGLAMCLSSNSQYPVIHCSLVNKEQQNNIFDVNSFISNDTSLFTVVFTLSSAIQNVIQILALNDWKLWTKQRGRRFKKCIDLIIADQQLTTTQTIKTNSNKLINK
jgi:phosphoribosylaminoimidazole-succinocarboxamide synthase